MKTKIQTDPCAAAEKMFPANQTFLGRMFFVLKMSAKPLVFIIVLAHAGLAAFAAPTPVSGPATFASDDAFLDYVEHQTFNYFWTEVDTNTGLIRLRSDDQNTCSIAAVGFGLSAICVGIDRGWITRDQGRARVLAALNTLYNAPQGSGTSGFSGYHGWFYHHLIMNSGVRDGISELSSSDTTLLLSGVIDAGIYFNDTNNTDEGAIRTLSGNIFNRVDYQFMLKSNDNTVYLDWNPENGGVYSSSGYTGFNEVAYLYIYGLGATNNPLPEASWTAWVSGFSWQTYYGYSYAYISRLFCYQYSHCFIDFRGIMDTYMRGKGSDYFENSRYATLAQQAYAIDNPSGYPNYGSNEWGFTSCSTPAGYVTCGAPGGTDNGTIAPTAAAGSMPFAPEICLPTIRHLYDTYTNKLWTTEGFLDSFNVASNNWFASATLAIDEGPIVLMLENYRTGSVWTRMMSSPVIQRGLQRAGFTAPPPDTINATLVSSNQISVSWSGRSVYQTGFQVLTSTDGVNFNIAITVSSNINNATISWPSATTCYLRVVTTSSAGISGFRQTVIIPGTGTPPAVAFYEPFKYETGSALDGQGGWYLNGSVSLGTIEAGNLSVPDLATAVGNRFTWPVGNDSVRLPFGAAVTNGALYFSFALRIDEIGSFVGHDTFAGLTLGDATTYFPKIDAVCNSSNAYQIAIYKGSGTTYGNVASPIFTTNDTVFIVARYTFNNNSTTDDTCDLWVNPDPSTFGAPNPPTPTIIGTGNGGMDAAAIDRLTWRGTTTGAQKKTVDELRIGSSWSAVTPPYLPVLTINITGSNAMLSWPTNGSAGFGLEEATQLIATAWTPITGVIMQGTNNVISINATNGQQFFRLIK